MPGRVGAVLAGMIVVSAGIRSAIAWDHPIPRLFPDEYIYAALGRSIGHGRLAIRGATVHFPGIFEPVLAAPIWRFFDLTTAYHLVQVENAVAASLAAIPVYLLARSVKLSSSYALACAAYALLVPELVIVAFTSSDAVGYLLALAALLIGVVAVENPSRRNQLAFLAFAAVATLTRVQYAVLAPAYVIAAVALDGRAALRRHRLTLLTLLPALIVVLAGAHSYYAVHLGTWFSAGFVEWFPLQLFLLAIEFGVVAGPGAILGLTVPGGRREKTFVVFTAAFAVALLAETARIAAETSEFKERYLFVLLALAPVCFGLYFRNRSKRAIPVIALAAVIAVTAARVPLSGYATATFKLDSQFLFAVSDLQDRIGTDTASLVIALATTAGAVLAIAVAYRGGVMFPLSVSAGVAVLATVAAVRMDLRTTRAVRAELPPDLEWVDHAARGPVDAIETPVAQKEDLLYQLYWNTSIRRELLLGNAVATDAFNAPHLQIRSDGSLANAPGEVLFHDFGTTGRLMSAQRIASHYWFTLWRPTGRARLRLVVQGRFYDGWLNPIGRLRAWARRPGTGLTVSFRLSLPPKADRVVRVAVGGGSFTVRPRRPVRVRCSTTRDRLDVGYSAVGLRVLPNDFRSVTVRMLALAVADGGKQTSPTCGRE